MPEPNEKLRREILEDAKRRADRILKRAKREAENLQKTARENAERRREQQLAAARTTAEEKARIILAGIDQEAQRLWTLKREEVLETVFSQALAQAETVTGAEAEEAMSSLIREAVRPFAGEKQITIRLSPGDLRALTEAGVREIVCDEIPSLKPEAVTVVSDSDLPSRGAVAESADGRRRRENTLATRLRRLKESLRPQVAKMLESPAPAAPAAKPEKA